MASFEGVRKAIWHAFHALDDQEKGSVLKSQLKVLTHNVSNALKVQVQKPEEKLEEFKKNSMISFEDYIFFMKSEILGDVTEVGDSSSQKAVDEVCWMICAARYTNKVTKSDDTRKVLKDNDAFKLWKIFNSLVEHDEDGQSDIPLVMDLEEVELLFKRCMDLIGKQFDSEPFDEIRKKSLEENDTAAPRCNFKQLITLFEQEYNNGLEPIEMAECINEVYEEIINDIIKKGFLSKRGEAKVSSWKERFFVLRPDTLRYYVNKELKDMKGEIHLSDCEEVKTVAPDAKPNRLNLCCGGRTYELAADDFKTRNIWVATLKNLRKHFQKDKTYQQCLFEKRRSERIQRRTKQKDEKEHLETLEKTVQVQSTELETEKTARSTAEEQLASEKTSLEEERRARKELEEQNEGLYNQLEDEKQARRDEEIVRGLQARLLEEETQRRQAVEEERQNLEEKLAQAKDRIEELEKRVAELERLLEETKTAKEETAEELVQVTSQKDEQEHKCASLEASLLTFEQLNTELDERVKVLEQVRADVEEKYMTEKNRNDELEMIKSEQEKFWKEAAVRVEAAEKEKAEAFKREQEMHERLMETVRKYDQMLGKSSGAQTSVRSNLAKFFSSSSTPIASHRGTGVFTEGEFEAHKNRRKSGSGGPLDEGEETDNKKTEL